jgi:acyl-CoA synthetase (AMP-forming)/AMP-acid ligase II
MSSPITNERPAIWSVIEEERLPVNLHSLLDETAAKYPDRTFWHSIDGDQFVLTYDEFRRLSVICAQKFRQLGLGKGKHVALMLPNAPAFMIAWFALCRLGAVGVMVNTASTPSELDRIIRQTDIEFLVIDQQYLGAYLDLPIGSRLTQENVILHHRTTSLGSLPSFTEWASLIEGEEEHDDLPQVMADDVAAIMFTSGSSGVPKACMLSHQYWLTLAKARLVIGPPLASVMADTPMYYMGCLWKILMGIYSSAVIHVAPRLSLSRLADRIVDNNVEFCTVTAPAAKLSADPRLKKSSLKWVTTYGLAKELHAGIEERFGVPVREIYGMTEVGSALSMPVEDRSMIGSGSCGRPALFRRCKIMMDGKEIRDGSPGELWVAGPGLFSGYYRNQEATKASFEGEWFKTGDLFRRDEAGYYYMLGRIKDVIRRGGENISASEVELTVTAIDGVLEAAVIPVPDAFRGEEVKVVVARAPNELGSQLTAEQILHTCRQVLSAYKVPRYVEFMEALPKTPSSKIDKVKLKVSASNVSAQVYDATMHNEGNKS